MNRWKPFENLQEIQLTSDNKGHFLHTTQYFSPDNCWIVYDTRNDGTHIGRTCCIEMVHTQTKEIKQLYKTPGQTQYGPGVGGATFNPVNDSVLFIHGLMNCNKDRPYGFSRRTGVVVDIKRPGKAIFMDARDVLPPFTSGALRGGTHAHTWSADGMWISFTYNDALMEELEKEGAENIKDLRMVGIMAPVGPVKVENNGSGENIDGEMFTVVVTSVTENPEPGSDEIDRAYEDGWVGKNGYVKEDGSRQKRAVAFLGDTRDQEGNKLTEVFIADIPEDVTLEISGQPMAGTVNTRPNPPEGVHQRRLTYTSDHQYPGVQGPRHWLRSSPDGTSIYFLRKDGEGIVQIHAVSSWGGEIRQITFNDFPVETTFNVSPDGQFLAYGNQQRVYLTHIHSGETRPVTSESAGGMTGLKSIHWSHDGQMLAYNRKIAMADTSYYQVFLLKSNISNLKNDEKPKK